ncbi:MAG: hypothetical protein CO099_10855 [Bdellovibrio sp. CG_4_9_14_3_um_filter_39_7]|nr:MAG: hypothetical protein CO099_10855 [Bdellovibrio sp. CG_4_9_14_3_um_filter_39_7]
MAQNFAHLEQRSQDQLISQWHLSDEKRDIDVLFLTTEDDLGVTINGGRAGARWAPEAVLNVMNKMIAPQDQLRLKKIKLEASQENLKDKQTQYANDIQEQIKKWNPKLIIHLGGGHDHIYPLLMALKSDPLLVINVDPHLDTRNDSEVHSGTPFRQFSQQKSDWKCIQWGTHHYANAPANFQGLEKVMHIVDDHTISRDNERAHALIRHEIASWNGQAILSLDADALSSSIMSGVSAVNPLGLSPEEVARVFETYATTTRGRGVIGIYEYNPLFDDLSQKGARYLAQLIWNLLNHLNKA